MPMKPRGEAGFTLIELLVGLTLAGFIVAALAGAVRTGLLSAAAVEISVDETNTVRQAQRFLRHSLETARPVQWGSDRSFRAAFDGNAESLDFLAIRPPWPSRGGTYLIRLSRRGNTLLMTSRVASTNQGGFDFSVNSEHRVLADEVSAVRFSYFGTPGRAKAAGWHAAWRGETSLPRLVRLRVEYRAGSGRIWPELVVAPIIGQVPR